MNNIEKLIRAALAASLLSSCSQVLETVDLKIATKMRPPRKSSQLKRRR